MFVKKLISKSRKKCPILAGTLKSSDLEPSLAGHYGVPTTSTTLAFDSIQCILAIASRDGRIKLFGADEAQVLLHSPNPTSCKFLQFFENQGILLNLTSRNDIEVWDVDKKELAHVYSCKEITAFTVLQGTPFMYIGDMKGNVSVLQFDRETKQISCMQYSIPISITHGVFAEVRRDTSVVCILPQPLYELSRVLVIFKSGLLILWGIQESQVLAVCGNVIVAYQRESQTSNLLQNRDNEEDKQISSACWASSNGSRIAIGYTDGDIWLWSVPTTSKLKYNSDAKGLESQDSQCSPISKVQLSNRKAKVPIFSLKWHPGSDIWGCLYVYGGVDFDSSHMIRVIRLQESGITTNQNNLCELELVFPGPFIDMSILSNKHSKNKAGGESLLVLTKTGQLSSYDIIEIEKQLLDGEHRSLISQLRSFMVKPPFADSSVTAAKLVTIPNDIASSNALAQLHRSSKQFFPSTIKWLAIEKISTDTEGSVTIRSVYITGHSNGTINVWDASSPRMLLVLTIKAPGDVETTVRGCPVTAVDFCPVSCLLAIGDQLGRVQIYKIVSKHQEVKIPLNKGSTHQEKSLESTADVLKVGVLKVHKAAIRCISVDSSSTHVAAGCEEGSVSLIDTKSCTLLSFKGYFSGFSSSITSLRFEKSVFPGSGKSVLFVAARDASVIAIDGDTGHCLSPSIVKPKQPSTAIFMHVLEPSIDTRGGSNEEKSPLPKQLNLHEENDTSHTDATQPLLLLCSENCLWLYSASAITQGTKKVYLKEKFQTTCSWASAFQSSNYGFGLFLLFTTGKIEIRSLPDLSVLKETTLSRCSSCDLKPSTGLINSLSCASDGRLVMIDGDQELFFVSLLNEDNDFRLSGSKVQVYDKEIQISPDHPVVHLPHTTKKKSLVKALIKVKVSKSKNSSEDEDKQAATPLRASELCSIFSTRNFPTSAASLDERPISDIDDKELDIDDLDIEDHDENCNYHRSGASNNGSLVSKFRRKLKGIKRSKDIQSTNTPIKGNGEEDITRIRTIEDIKSAYGHSQLKEPKVHELAKEKLLENQIKLQGINQRTAKMEEGAENFQSMAEELLKIVKEKKG